MFRGVKSSGYLLQARVPAKNCVRTLIKTNKRKTEQGEGKMNLLRVEELEGSAEGAQNTSPRLRVQVVLWKRQGVRE